MFCAFLNSLYFFEFIHLCRKIPEQEWKNSLAWKWNVGDDASSDEWMFIHTAVNLDVFELLQNLTVRFILRRCCVADETVTVWWNCLMVWVGSTVHQWFAMPYSQYMCETAEMQIALVANTVSVCVVLSIFWRLNPFGAVGIIVLTRQFHRPWPAHLCHVIDWYKYKVITLKQIAQRGRNRRETLHRPLQRYTILWDIVRT